MRLSDIPRVGHIDRQTFQRSYFSPQTPVVLTQMAASWPALSRWTPAFFTQNYGNRPVKLVDAEFVKPGKHYMRESHTLPLTDYLNRVLVENQDLRIFLYNIKSELPDLLDDIRLPDLVDGVSKRFVFMFFGCRDSVTQMHYDIDMSNVFHTVIQGKRTITLFPLHQSHNLHRFPFTCRSYVDVHDPDYARFPRLREAEGARVTLEPGDTLFIPAGYWHHVVYDEPGYALSLRCENAQLAGRLRGLYNLTVMQSIDRVMNRLSPDSWFAWKEKRALSF